MQPKQKNHAVLILIVTAMIIVTMVVVFVIRQSRPLTQLSVVPGLPAPYPHSGATPTPMPIPQEYMPPPQGVLSYEQEQALAAAKKLTKSDVVHELENADINAEGYDGERIRLVNGEADITCRDGKTIDSYFGTGVCGKDSDSAHISLSSIIVNDDPSIDFNQAYSGFVGVGNVIFSKNGMSKKGILVFSATRNIGYYTSLVADGRSTSTMNVIALLPAETNAKVSKLHRESMRYDITFADSNAAPISFVYQDSYRYGPFFSPIITRDGAELVQMKGGEGVSFEIPIAYVMPGAPFVAVDRNSASSYIKDPKPVYYSEACNAENSFSDLTFSFFPITDDIKMTLGIHTKADDEVDVTTSSYGYDPSEWGKILGSYSVNSIKNNIENKKLIPGKKTESLAVAGKTIRHIFPDAAPRNCQYSTKGMGPEQYQWVTGGNLVTMTIWSGVTSDDKKQQLLDAVAGTLRVK